MLLKRCVAFLLVLVVLIISVDAKQSNYTGDIKVFRDGDGVKNLFDQGTHLFFVDVPNDATYSQASLKVRPNGNSVRIEARGLEIFDSNETGDADFKNRISSSGCTEICSIPIEIILEQDGDVTIDNLKVTYTTTTVPVFLRKIGNFQWNQGGELVDAFNLEDYFYIDNSSFFKNVVTQGDKNDLTITIEDGDVSFSSIASFSGTIFVKFSADDDIDAVDSNEVQLTVNPVNNADNTVNKVSDFFPVGDEVELEFGEKLSFAISGENVSAVWYLNGLKLSETSGTFVFIGDLPGETEIRVVSERGSKTWTVLVAEEEIIKEMDNLNEVQRVNQCGNGIRESAENCGNCPSDVQCSEGSSCKNSICVKEESGFNKVILWLIIFAFLIGGLVFGVIFAKKKGLLDNFDFLKNFFNKINFFKKFKKKKYSLEEKIIVKKKDKPNEDLSQLKNYLFDNLKKGFNKDNLIKQALAQGWNQEQINHVLKIKNELKPLYDYITLNLKKGFKKEELMKQAIRQGWSTENVEEVISKL